MGGNLLWGFWSEAPTEAWTGVGTVKQTKYCDSQLSRKKNKPLQFPGTREAKSNWIKYKALFPVQPPSAVYFAISWYSFPAFTKFSQ